METDLASSYERCRALHRRHGRTYYLATRHGITDVAVLERGWIGGGNMGRNTTIIRSNYLTPEGVAFYDESVRL